VWDAWANVDELARWWGPRGFTLTTHSRDLRSGGHWHYTMHGPDGTDYENTTRYLEVVPMKRMVYDHGGHRDRPPLFRVTVMFSEVRGRTRMDMTMSLPTPEAAEQARAHIRKAGGDSTWDRLAEHVAKHVSGREQFVIARSFDADPATVYAMWTDPQHLSQWFGPAGSTMRLLRSEPHAGGTSFFMMRQPDGQVLHGLIHYVELAAPHRIVYRQQFCDEHGRVTRAPFFPHWPETMLTTVELAEEGPARTRVRVTWEPAEGAGPEDVAEFSRQRGSLTMGWTGSFDRLEALLGHRNAA